jgi:hypothetical protein
MVLCLVRGGGEGGGGAEEQLLGNPVIRKPESKPVFSTVTISVRPFLSTPTP